MSRRRKRTEADLQEAVCRYIRHQYPDVFFNGSAGGVRTSLSQGKLMKRTGYQKGFPDLFLYEPRGEWHGLAIELKMEKGRATKEQEQVLQELRARGYAADVAKGFDEAKALIDKYMDK